MNKTMLALTMTSLFSTGVMAQEIKASDVYHEVKGWTYGKSVDGDDVAYDRSGNYIGTVMEGDGYITISNEKSGDVVQIDHSNGEYTYWDKNNAEVTGRIVNNITNGDHAQHPDNNRSRGIHGIAKKYGAEVTKSGDIRFSKGELTGVTIRAADGMIVDKSGKNVVNVDRLSFDKNGNLILVDNDAKTPNKDDSKLRPADDKSNWGPNNKVIEEDTNLEADVEEAATEIAAKYNSDVSAAQSWAAQAEQQFQAEVARLDNKIDRVEGRVSNGAAMAGAMSQMQFAHSGLGIGAGVAEFNGSKAIAVGVGYAFGSEKQWMAKGSFGYSETSKGKSNGKKVSDTMAAAGLTYSFK